MKSLLLALLLAATPALAGPPPEMAARDFIARQTLEGWTSFQSRAEAMAWRDAFVAELQPSLGVVRGYKAALTNPQVQRKFGVPEPILGILLDGMFIPPDAGVDAHFGARPMLEADLVARVGDEAINAADADLELLNAIEAFIPFVELPDLLLPTNVVANALDLAAINAGARGGILGAPISLGEGDDPLRRLAFFTVAIKDSNGRRLAEGSGGALLGHPLKAARWIRDEAQRQGRTLKKGDLLSLGSLTTMLPLTPGERYAIIYEGLDPAGPQTIQVRVRANSE